MNKRIKYPKEKYVDYDIPSDDMENFIRNYKSRIVRTRKEHKCCYCGSLIQENDDALNFKVITKDGEFCNGYYCLSCVEDYMDNANGIIDSDELVHRYSERVNHAKETD